MIQPEEKKCPNCGATENNWEKHCSDCKKEFCYKCVDEHTCHTPQPPKESIGKLLDKIDKANMEWLKNAGSETADFLKKLRESAFQEGKAQGRKEVEEMIKNIKGADDNGSIEFVKSVIIKQLTK